MESGTTRSFHTRLKCSIYFVTGPKFSAAGSVLVLAPVRAPAEEVALAARGSAPLGVRRFAFREFVVDLSAAELNRRGLVPGGTVRA
jgi:hypothetical protein